jgi:glycine oxidase
VRALILGAGIIGVSIADALARRGVDVVVLDMRGPGRGATHASAGILAPYTEAQPDNPLLTLGRRSLEMFDEFVGGVAERASRRVEYARTGTLEVATDETAAMHLRAAHDWLGTIGVAADWIDAADLPAIEPAVAEAALGALLIREHGYVGVATLLSALVQSARLGGAVFETPVETAEILAGRGDLVVRANGDPYSADVVVVATGSWTGRLRLNGARPWPIRPVRGQLIEIGWPDDRPLPERVIWGPGCYCVPWTTGALLVGATSEDVGFDEHSTVSGVAALLSAAAALLPAVRDFPINGIRVGLRPAAPDGIPVVGPLSSHPSIVLATGHYRNGVLLAPLTAAVVARYLCDGERDPMLESTTPDRL